MLLASRAPKPRKALASPEERRPLLDALERAGWPADEVSAVIQVESGWRPDARNPISDASGLIQFMPSTLAKLGFEPNAATGAERARRMRALSILEQTPWVVRYFAAMPAWRVRGDTYLAVAAPSAIGAPDAHVVYDVGTKAWEQNPGLRVSPNGPITAGSIRAVILKRMR